VYPKNLKNTRTGYKSRIQRDIQELIPKNGLWHQIWYQMEFWRPHLSKDGGPTRAVVARATIVFGYIGTGPKCHALARLDPA
jgi:hypothetical protein